MLLDPHIRVLEMHVPNAGAESGMLSSLADHVKWPITRS